MNRALIAFIAIVLIGGCGRKDHSVPTPRTEPGAAYADSTPLSYTFRITDAISGKVMVEGEGTNIRWNEDDRSLKWKDPGGIVGVDQDHFLVFIPSSWYIMIEPKKVIEMSGR